MNRWRAAFAPAPDRPRGPPKIQGELRPASIDQVLGFVRCRIEPIDLGEPLDLGVENDGADDDHEDDRAEGEQQFLSDAEIVEGLHEDATLTCYP